MRNTLRFVLVAGVLSLSGCKATFDVPPIRHPLQLKYPEGFAGDFPHLNPGQRVVAKAVVTDYREQPVTGVEVVWDDGYFPVRLDPVRALSDSEGVASTTWEMPSLPGNAFSAPVAIHAYLAGADGSPLEYRAVDEVCTRC